MDGKNLHDLSLVYAFASSGKIDLYYYHEDDMVKFGLILLGK